jgi:hypothetical protein
MAETAEAAEAMTLGAYAIVLGPFAALRISSALIGRRGSRVRERTVASAILVALAATLS